MVRPKRSSANTNDGGAALFSMILAFTVLMVKNDRTNINHSFAQAFAVVTTTTSSLSTTLTSPSLIRRPTTSALFSTLLTSSSEKENDSSVMDTKKASSQLVNILADRYNNNNEQSSSSAATDTEENIESLMRYLIDSKVKFDPNECIFGDFFATIYVLGPTPLWERLSQGRSKNIKGQKFYTDADSGMGRFVNYAEVFGKGLQLRAYGSCSKSSEQPNKEGTNQKTNDRFSSPLDFITFFLTNNKAPTLASEQCPVDYTATVQKGSIFFVGKEFDISINGVGTLRVLYADPELRIFVNVGDNTDAKWEKDGLYVVQVKSDLISPSIVVDL